MKNYKIANPFKNNFQYKLVQDCKEYNNNNENNFKKLHIYNILKI